ncbi:stearoyl-CoA desaturase (delta-9 desaturase) [Verrucomicrobium sp. GAS474]|uniref:fatty acid desaturase n=1 Tax=Verrucomicrobium sp. GAS474 TaxID=1882831 RepID=UPI00087CF38E|nr:fatty acid desaturase [Verrucomicrobium sp. GAS474]SDU20465.1 stearoyl-CoA desaturase (delta-9 desaturase) [Verrucomicrobium sp. GAS474]
MFGLKKPHVVNWTTTLFLSITFLSAAIGTPYYLYTYGWSTPLFLAFLFMFSACCMSITFGYHRLFSHTAFKASWPVRLLVLIFGAASFENSALLWSSEHRRHHKHTDHEDEDPYSISRGFFFAHMGWLFLRYTPERPLDNVADLRKDKLVMWQHRYVQLIAAVVTFVIPCTVGWFVSRWDGFLGCLFIVGFLRIVCVHHVTFFINSLCHVLGKQPYSSRTSARDSWIMAILTFGEGYHNYHHEFQHDYRNGIRKWQWDPTKWSIWLLNKVGLTWDLRRVPKEKILLAQIAQKERALEARLGKQEITLSGAAAQLLETARQHLAHAAEAWETHREARNNALKAAAKTAVAHESEGLLATLRREEEAAAKNLRLCIRAWRNAYRVACATI